MRSHRERSASAAATDRRAGRSRAVMTARARSCTSPAANVSINPFATSGGQREAEKPVPSARDGLDCHRQRSTGARRFEQCRWGGETGRRSVFQATDAPRRGGARLAAPARVRTPDRPRTEAGWSPAARSPAPNRRPTSPHRPFDTHGDRCLAEPARIAHPGPGSRLRQALVSHGAPRSRERRVGAPARPRDADPKTDHGGTQNPDATAATCP